MLVWKRRKYDDVFSVRRISKKVNCRVACLRECITLLKKAEVKILETFARVSDRGKEGSAIASSIQGVGGASLLMPNGYFFGCEGHQSQLQLPGHISQEVFILSG